MVNLHVISGCSGGGKSTLITALAKLGCHVFPEPGRDIVKKQLAIDGTALPWLDLDGFLDLTLEKNIANHLAASQLTGDVFFDRSLIDTISDQKQPKKFRDAAAQYRYGKKVFLVPPWEEIYQTDEERRHSFAEAVDEYHRLIRKYPEFGYDIVEIPKSSVKDRVSFILSEIPQVSQ